MIDSKGFYKKRAIYIGKDNPLQLRNGKEYDVIVGQLGAYCVIDETGEEYAYPARDFTDIAEEREGNIKK